VGVNSPHFFYLSFYQLNIYFLIIKSINIMELKQSERKNSKIKVAVSGGSGSGKTYSALLVAYGITGDWGKIAVIDTENGSANLYAHLGDYKVFSMEVPFSPEKYIHAINVCEQAGIEVVIIDSISHCWENLLASHAAMTGNSFVNWNKITPRYNAFVQKILQSNCHVICTMRTKQDYNLTEKDGKLVPQKAGKKVIMREGINYEFTVVMEMDINHRAKITKDRTGIFSNQTEFVPSFETGKIILEWCNGEAKVIELNPQNNLPHGSLANYAKVS
jgi:hypothetical protein